MEITVKSRKEAQELLYDHDFDVLVSIGAIIRLEAYDSFKGKKILFEFYDLQEDNPQYPIPTKQDIKRLIEFYRTLSRSSNVLIHCAAGISRSTACAYILLCLLFGPEKEKEALAELERIRPELWPNRLIVKFGDELLGREGNMLEEIDRFFERSRGKLWTP